ncbi:hypothetical protein BT69DRAFT_1279078 [Atractiella rhizophila]|nr:hypothetical protein BT69DRAFT_1279078 [Atractiella rhizophila]
MCLLHYSSPPQAPKCLTPRSLCTLPSYSVQSQSPPRSNLQRINEPQDAPLPPLHQPDPPSQLPLPTNPQRTSG